MSRGEVRRDTTRDAWSITLFDDRYGLGAQERLLAMLRQPCITFARIAEQYGVTRECVRQWHKRLLPEAPTGHERQRQCRQLRHRRRLSKDPLVVGFHRRIRAQFPQVRLMLVPSHDGYRSRSIRANDRLVGLTRATWVDTEGGGAGFVLTYTTWTVDYVYCEVGDTEFLFLPREALPRRTTRLDEAMSLLPYRNTFSAFEADLVGAPHQSSNRSEPLS
jgi:hypothetical protein